MGEGILQQIQKELNIPTFSFKSRDSGEQLTLTVFNGRLRLTVWPPKDSNNHKPVFGESMQPAGFTMFKRMMAGAMDMKGGERNSILFNKWDQDSKKNNPMGSLVLTRDDKMQFAFELQFQFNGNNKVIQFGITATQAMQPTANEFGWTERSVAQVDAINDWLVNIVPLAMVLTGSKNFGGGNSGGGGGGSDYGKNF